MSREKFDTDDVVQSSTSNNLTKHILAILTCDLLKFQIRDVQPANLFLVEKNLTATQK
jgi:hypothetical protein